MRNNTLNCQYNMEITYVLLFDILCSYDKNDIWRNIKGWLNNVYKDKNPQYFEKIVLSIIFNNIKISTKW